MTLACGGTDTDADPDSDLLTGHYWEDHGCAEGLGDVLMRDEGAMVLLTSDFSECRPCDYTRTVSQDMVTAAERSVDEDDQAYAQGYVRCYEQFYDVDCAYVREECFVFKAAGMVGEDVDTSAEEQRTATVGYGFYQGAVDGEDCLDSDAESGLESDTWGHTPGIDSDLDNAFKAGYPFGWLQGHVECRDEMDDWKDGPTEEDE